MAYFGETFSTVKIFRTDNTNIVKGVPKKYSKRQKPLSFFVDIMCKVQSIFKNKHNLIFIHILLRVMC